MSDELEQLFREDRQAGSDLDRYVSAMEGFTPAFREQWTPYWRQDSWTRLSLSAWLDEMVGFGNGYRQCWAPVWRQDRATAPSLPDYLSAFGKFSEGYREQWQPVWLSDWVAALYCGLSAEGFALRAVLEAAHELVQNAEEIGLRVRDTCRTCSRGSRERARADPATRDHGRRPAVRAHASDLALARGLRFRHPRRGALAPAGLVRCLRHLSGGPRRGRQVEGAGRHGGSAARGSQPAWCSTSTAGPCPSGSTRTRRSGWWSTRPRTGSTNVRRLCCCGVCGRGEMRDSA